jgi:hypothetical protein
MFNRYQVALAALLLSGCLLMSACGGAPARVTAIDFAGGAFGFLFVDNTPMDAADTRLEWIEGEGGPAVKAVQAGGGVPYIVIDAASILGDAVTELREMQVTLGVDTPNGEFYAVSGEILAYSGKERVESVDSWSVYLPERNPNIASAVLKTEAEWFVPDAYNFFVLTKQVDNAALNGQIPENLIIYGIRFLNAAGEELLVNPAAGFAAPEGFGAYDRSNLAAVSGETVLNAEDADGGQRP